MGPIVYSSLILAILDQTSQRRGEFVTGFLRLAFETNVNIRFLVRNQNDETVNSYVMHSLKFEKKLHNIVTAQIAETNGEPMPIQRRILKSVQRVINKVGCSIDDIDTKSNKNWANKNIFEKTQEVGLADFYTVFFRGGSNFIHVNFTDLYEFHMQPVEGGYKPFQTFKRPKPQPISAIALVTTDTVIEYFEYLEASNLIDGECVSLICGRIDSLIDSIKQVAIKHEEYLNR